jgi:hypothetical protein
MERNELDAQDNIWEPFSAPKTFPFLNFDVIDLPTDTILEPRLVTIHIEVTHHHTTVTRRNYTLFDFVGDVGALKDSLLDICTLFLGLFKIQILLENYILNALFRTKSGKPLNLGYFQYLWDRFIVCCFCRQRKRLKLRAKGMDLVEKHLDAVYYLRRSIMTQAALRQLLHREERRQIKKFTLSSDSDPTSGSDSGKKEEAVEKTADMSL